MTYNEVLAYFGTQHKIAAALGTSQAAVSRWGGKVPRKFQYQVEILTDGALRADEELRHPVRVIGEHRTA